MRTSLRLSLTSVTSSMARRRRSGMVSAIWRQSFVPSNPEPIPSVGRGPLRSRLTPKPDKSVLVQTCLSAHRNIRDDRSEIFLETAGTRHCRNKELRSARQNYYYEHVRS